MLHLSNPPKAFRSLWLRAKAGFSEVERALPPKRQLQVRLPEAQIAEIVARYQAGERAHVLAAEFGVDRTRIPEYLKRAGVEKRERSLSSEQIAEAADLYTTGLSLTAVGSQLGLNRSTIHKAFKRKGIETRTGKQRPERHK